jgi:hypothetical protein
MVGGQSGGEVGPPCPSVAQELLCCKECLLMFGITKEPELGLNGTKLMIGLKRFSCFGEGWRAGCQELRIGGRSLPLGVPHPIATTSRVVHELVQQFGLLVPRLEDGGDGLSQGWRWRRVANRLSSPGITPSIAIVHHTVI